MVEYANVQGEAQNHLGESLTDEDEKSLYDRLKRLGYVD
jgi:hypothetical protein